MGVEQAREAAAAAARAAPPPPQKIDAVKAPVFGAAAAGNISDISDGAPAARAHQTASLAKCGYYFEDASDDLVKVTVPLEAACAGEPLPKEGAVACVFSDFTFKLEVTIGTTVHARGLKTDPGHPAAAPNPVKPVQHTGARATPRTRIADADGAPARVAPACGSPACRALACGAPGVWLACLWRYQTSMPPLEPLTWRE